MLVSLVDHCDSDPGFLLYYSDAGFIPTVRTVTNVWSRGLLDIVIFAAVSVSIPNDIPQESKVSEWAYRRVSHR